MKVLVKVLSSLFAGGVLMVLAAALYIYFELVPQLPAIDKLEDTKYQVPLRIYDKNDFKVFTKEFASIVQFPVSIALCKRASRELDFAPDEQPYEPQ